MMVEAIYSMQEFMNSSGKIVICTTDDRKIRVSKTDSVFAEGKFIMIKVKTD